MGMRRGKVIAKDDVEADAEEEVISTGEDKRKRKQRMQRKVILLIGKGLEGDVSDVILTNTSLWTVLKSV